MDAPNAIRIGSRFLGQFELTELDLPSFFILAKLLELGNILLAGGPPQYRAYYSII